MSDLLSGIGSLAKSVTSNISTYEIRKLSEKVQGMVMNFTETEQVVRDATNEDPWGPTGPQMKEVAHLTFSYDNFQQVMTTLWKRMFEDNKYAWRRVYKSLMLLNHLLAHGSERVIASARDHSFQMRSLEHYKHIDEKGKDQGINVRHRAKLILELLGDEEKLRAERAKAKQDDKSKFQGFSADDMKMGGGGRGFGGGSFSKKDDLSMREEDEYDSHSKKSNRRPSFEYNAREREINSFSFPSDRRESNSPELGFRENRAQSNGAADDDGFGDFATARSSGPNNGSATKAQTANVSRISSGAPPPALPPPSVGYSKIVAAPQANNSIDLLGLDFSSPASGPTSLPRPPSGGGAGPDFMGDLFSSAPVSMHTSPPSGNVDFFATQHTSPTSDSFFEPDWSSAPATNAKPASSGGDFADFGNFNSSPAMPAMQSTPAHMSSPADDLFGLNVAPMTSMPAAQFSPLSFDMGTTMTPSKPSAAPMATPVSTPSTSTPTKVGSTWANTGGLIDLDNFGLKAKAPKANVPMNQMKPATPQQPGGNLW